MIRSDKIVMGHKGHVLTLGLSKHNIPIGVAIGRRLGEIEPANAWVVEPGYHIRSVIGAPIADN
jgi:hypothetical protein